MTLEALKKLNKLQAELKAKTIDKALTDRNFYERTSEMFKPLIESNEKQTEDINKNLKSLEENMKKTSPIQIVHQIIDRKFIKLEIKLEQQVENLCWFPMILDQGYSFGGSRTVFKMITNFIYKRSTN